MSNDIRAIAFYLPQFHPIPENDEWWGKGFTEWTNVTKAKPAFRGHYQPRLPADVGFYDLRLPEVRELQADLARQYGIHGFCYYHYWFNGRRILERPVNEVVTSGKPDFPFCLCWANENWTKVWDGGEANILLQQKHTLDDDRAHIRYLIDIFRDERYIRIDGKPLFLVYRTGLFPAPCMTSEIWKEEVKNAGFPDLYLVRVESHRDYTDPAVIGFDASVQFAPFNGLTRPLVSKKSTAKPLLKFLLGKAFFENKIFDYRDVVASMSQRDWPSYKRFYSVTPSWDNSARRKSGATILVDASPTIYQEWLANVAQRTVTEFAPEERIVFINAWNEWAEGNYLEPDQKWGHDYLKATKQALTAAAGVKEGDGRKKNGVGLEEGDPTEHSSGMGRMYRRLAMRTSRWSKLLRYARLGFWEA